MNSLRRFVFCSFVLLFHGLVFFFIQTGCMVQFTPGDGICGNGVKEEGEECDGADLGGATCEDLGFGSGELSCGSNCEYETSECGISECGNGVREEGEECDGEDLGGATCEDLGLGTGTLRCNENCTYDTTDCETGPFCGDDVREGSEECDGTDLGGETCETQGFYDGTLACLADCTAFDTSECSGFCGDGIINGGEVCDGTDLGGETCESRGYASGILACSSDCNGFDTSGCSTATTSLTWITIPGGTFDMGSNDGSSDELPIHSVTVPTFEMTKTQVTVEQYEECVTAGVCTEPSTGGSCNWDDPGYEDHPVNCIDWDQAREFCEWAGGRLPSEAEWEYAARSGGQDITYPWGNETPTCDYAVMNEGGYGCGTDRTWPVCSKVAGNTDQGLCDMAGNLWDWVEDDWHGDYNGAPSDGSAWVDEPRGSARVIRGGGFSFTAAFLRAADRGNHNPSGHYYGYGVRCARDAP